MRDKLHMFLSGWLGGPQLYVEAFGHPRLRARHLPFAIDRDARDQWMWCMEQALQEAAMDPVFRAEITKSLDRLATHMINRE
jgi:hemoglobin